MIRCFKIKTCLETGWNDLRAPSDDGFFRVEPRVLFRPLHVQRGRQAGVQGTGQLRDPAAQEARGPHVPRQQQAVAQRHPQRSHSGRHQGSNTVYDAILGQKSIN